MPKLSESTKTERRERIIVAARECFRRNGFSNTSMSDIVEASGMSAGSIYSHFEGKADIMRGTAESIFRAAINDLRELQRDKRYRPTPADLVKLLAITLRNNGLGPLLIQFISESTVNPELAGVAQENLRRARTVLSENLIPWTTARAEERGDSLDPADPSTDPERIANVIMVILHGFLLRTSVEPDVNLERLAADVATLMPDIP